MAELGQKLVFGGVSARNNLFLAPLAGYTDFAFRKLCYSFGAGLCFTEMVSAKGLLYNSEATRLLLHTFDVEENTPVQLFGSDPDILRAACESEDLAAFAAVDLNMGCPVPKVFKNGEGSALLANFPLAERIISACKKSGKTVSVKFRIGLERGKTFAAEFAKAVRRRGGRPHHRARQNAGYVLCGRTRLCADRGGKKCGAHSRRGKRRASLRAGTRCPCWKRRARTA